MLDSHHRAREFSSDHYQPFSVETNPLSSRVKKNPTLTLLFQSLNNFFLGGIAQTAWFYRILSWTAVLRWLVGWVLNTNNYWTVKDNSHACIMLTLVGVCRSLVALSLILAMLLFKPAPLYILDEVDAALDLSHTQNIGQMIRSHFKHSQVSACISLSACASHSILHT